MVAPSLRVICEHGRERDWVAGIVFNLNRSLGWWRVVQALERNTLMAGMFARANFVSSKQ